MSRITRGGTAEPVSRDQIVRREWGQGKYISLVQLTTSRIGNHARLIYTLLYEKMHNACTVWRKAVLVLNIYYIKCTRVLRDMAKIPGSHLFLHLI